MSEQTRVDGRATAPDTVDFAALLPRPEWHFPSAAWTPSFADASVVITGAGGSIGRVLTLALAAARPARLVLVESHEPSLFRLREQVLAVAPAATSRFVLADVRDHRKMERVFREERPDYVFSLAAYKHVPLAEDNADQVLAVNVQATMQLARLAHEFGVRRFVYPSTDKAVRPPSIYGATKRIAELVLWTLNQESARPHCAAVRLVNVFGTQGGVVETFGRLIRNGQPVTITSAEMTRYWMTMAETIGLLVHASQVENPGMACMVDAGDPVPILETARRLHALIDSDAPFRYTVTGVRPGERLHEELRYDFEHASPIGVAGICRLESPDVLGRRAESFVGRVADLIELSSTMSSREVKDAVFELVAGSGPTT